MVVRVGIKAVTAYIVGVVSPSDNVPADDGAVYWTANELYGSPDATGGRVNEYGVSCDFDPLRISDAYPEVRAVANRVVRNGEIDKRM